MSNVYKKIIIMMSFSCRILIIFLSFEIIVLFDTVYIYIYLKRRHDRDCSCDEIVMSGLK